MSAGLRFRPLPSETDYDDARLEEWHSQRSGRGRSRVTTGRDDILQLFVRPLAGQYRAIATALDDVDVDVVLSDVAFLGVLPLLLGSSAGRVPVLGVSTTPLSITSVDCAPFGAGMAPGRSAFTRMRNRQIDFLLRHGPLAPIGRELDTALAAVGAPPCPVSYFDIAALLRSHLPPLGRGAGVSRVASCRAGSDSSAHCRLRWARLRPARLGGPSSSVRGRSST